LLLNGAPRDPIDWLTRLVLRLGPTVAKRKAAHKLFASELARTRGSPLEMVNDEFLRQFVTSDVQPFFNGLDSMGGSPIDRLQFATFHFQSRLRPFLVQVMAAAPGDVMLFEDGIIHNNPGLNQEQWQRLPGNPVAQRINRIQLDRGHFLEKRSRYEECCRQPEFLSAPAGFRTRKGATCPPRCPR
jgi:hypothetical protein